MCANTSGVYEIDPIEGASSYQWTITGDATVSEQVLQPQLILALPGMAEPYV